MSFLFLDLNKKLLNTILQRQYFKKFKSFLHCVMDYPDNPDKSMKLFLKKWSVTCLFFFISSFQQLT